MVESAPSAPASLGLESSSLESSSLESSNLESSSPGSSSLLNRPEAVVFILIAMLIVLWDTYLELVDEVGSTSLSARQLSRRLGTTQKLIRSYKRQPNFSEWTQQLDPEGIAWVYSPGGVYTPKA